MPCVCHFSPSRSDESKQREARGKGDEDKNGEYIQKVHENCNPIVSYQESSTTTTDIVGADIIFHA